MMWQYLYWPAAVLLMAVGQGLLLPAIRRTPPGPEAKRQAFALHWVLTAVYFLPLVLVPGTWLEAVLSRLLLFDPAINLASGAKTFAVGATAITDRAIRQAASWGRMKPEGMRLLLWLLCLVLAVAGYWLLIK
jgi:hypothetical protein